MAANIEYRVRPVTRYIVTRYESFPDRGSCGAMGEYDNEYIAQHVAYALCKAEHERLGWGVGDERIKYPDMNPTAVFPDTQPVNAA